MTTQTENPLIRKLIGAGGVFAVFAFLGSYLRNSRTMPGVVGGCMAILSLVLFFSLRLAWTGLSLYCKSTQGA